MTWVSDDFLREHEVGQWMELPLWLVDAGLAGMLAADVSRATAAGLRSGRSSETLEGAPARRSIDGVGLTPEREAELLSLWHAQ